MYPFKFIKTVNMFGKKSLFISTLLVFASLVSAQHKQINGVILDSRNERPIEGANIFITRAEIGTTSDSDGFFRLLIDEKYFSDTLVVSYLGYKDFRVAIDSFKDRITILLTPDILELDQTISVTADIMNLAEREVAHSLHRIDAEEIERIGSGEISDLFKSVPAVRIEGNDLDGRRIQIRGSNSDEVNVYIDGVLINNLRYDQQADLTLIPTESIEKMDVLKGGNLLLLGNGAFGGVVNITTRKNFENSFGAKIKAGSFQTKFVLADVNLAPTDKFNINYFGQFNTSTPEIEFYQDERYSDKSLNNTIKTKKQNHHVNLNYFSSIGQYNAKFIGYFFDYEKAGWRNRYDNYILSANYRGAILGGRDYDFTISYLNGNNNVDRDQNEEQVHNSAYITSGMNVRLAKAFTFGQTDLQLMSEYFHDELKNTARIITYQADKVIYESDIYDNRLALVSLFSFKDTVASNRNISWKTYIGLRYDILANGRKDLTNSFGLQLNIKRNAWLIQPYGHYGKNVKYPTLLDNAFIRDVNDIFRSDTTTTRLEPEFNNTGEIGLNLSYQPRGAIYSSLDFVFALFNNTFYNKLLTRPSDSQISAAQLGRNETKGVEFSVAMDGLWHYFSLSAFLMNLNISDPFLYPYKPDRNYSLRLDFTSLAGFYFHTSYFYEGNSTAWYYDQNNVFQSEIIAPFYDFDVSFGYRIRVSKVLLNLQFSGYNILDNSEYRDYTLKKRFIQASFSVRY